MLLILSFEGNKVRTTLPRTLFVRITLQYSSKSPSLEKGQIQFVIQFICLGVSQAFYSCFATSEVELSQFSLEQILTGRKTLFFLMASFMFFSHTSVLYWFIFFPILIMRKLISLTQKNKMKLPKHHRFNVFV